MKIFSELLQGVSGRLRDIFNYLNEIFFMDLIL